MKDSAVLERPQGRRAKLTLMNKRQIAVAYVSGKSVAEICQEYSLSERGFYRLRQEDGVFQAAVEEFAQELYSHLQIALRRQATEAMETLAGILRVDACNFVEAEGPNGGRVVTRKIDPKLLAEKRLAAATLVDFWMKLHAHDEDTRRWQMLNVGSVGDEDEEMENEDKAD